MAGRLHPALREYLDVVRTLAPDANPSVFWERQLETFETTDARIDALSPDELDGLARGNIYGFEELPAGAVDSGYDEAADAMRRARKLARKLSPDGLGVDGDQFEHVRALDFLERHDLLEPYRSFIAPLGVRSSMSTARHFYYARQITTLAGEGALDVLEIGAGAGNLALFLTRMGVVRSYTIVDFPQMLVHSAYTLQRHEPAADLRFNAPPAPQGYTFVADFLAVEHLPPDAFDVCLNLNSFMEMDRETRDAYIAQIYTSGRPGSLFYNVNRRQPVMPLRDGGSWDNNPLLYPYRPDDEILVWEDDPFQTATRGKWGVPTTLAVTRAARIRPAAAAAARP